MLVGKWGKGAMWYSKNSKIKTFAGPPKWMKCQKFLLFKGQRFLYKGFGQIGPEWGFPIVFLFKDQIGPNSLFIRTKSGVFIRAKGQQ